MMNEAKIVWLRPAKLEDCVGGHVQSIWGVEVNGVMQEHKFTSKRAATQWAVAKGWKISR